MARNTHAVIAGSQHAQAYGFPASRSPDPREVASNYLSPKTHRTYADGALPPPRLVCRGNNASYTATVTPAAAGEP